MYLSGRGFDVFGFETTVSVTEGNGSEETDGFGFSFRSCLAASRT